MDISHWIRRHAMSTPAKVALQTPDNHYTYLQLEAQIEAVARMLKWAFGVGKGDRVAFLSNNCAEFLITLFACARIGAIFVPLNGRLTIPEHLYILQNADVKVLLLQAAFSKLVTSVQEALPHCRLIGIDFAPTDGAAWQILLTTPHNELRASHTPEADLADPFLIVYTSGTTGYPKGAVHTQASVLWHAIQCVQMNDLTSTDHVLTVVPLFHVGGMNIQTLPAFYCGATVTLCAQFIPDQILATIEEQRITITCLVPSMIIAMVNTALWAKTDFSHLRTVVTGSTFVPRSCRDAFEARGVQVIVGYGSTETGAISIYMRFAYQGDKLDTIGLPAAHCLARVVDDAGRDQPAGEAGEILIKGPSVMLGYWQNEAATAQALRNGWYHTGDVGYRDADDYFYISDRKKNMIIKGGENIYPSEVERVLDTHPAIKESAVIGLPDPRWQEVPVAVLVAPSDNQPTVTELRAFLADKLADYKIPVSFVFAKALPKNVLGKIQHFHVREELQNNPELRAQLPSTTSDIQALLAELLKELTVHNAASNGSAAPQSLQQALIGTPVAQRAAFLTNYLGRLVKGILHLPPGDGVEPSENLLTLGIDSLMAMELRDHIRQTWSVNIDVARFLAGLSIAELTAEIMTQADLSQQGAQPFNGAIEMLENVAQPSVTQAESATAKDKSFTNANQDEIEDEAAWINV